MTIVPTCAQSVYRNWLATDAAAIRRRVALDMAAMRAEESEIDDDTPLSSMIDAMLRVTSCTTPATLEMIVDRVAGLHPDTARKHMLRLRQRGLIVEAGFVRSEASGQQRKLWLRVAK